MTESSPFRPLGILRLPIKGFSPDETTRWTTSLVSNRFIARGSLCTYPFDRDALFAISPDCPRGAKRRKRIIARRAKARRDAGVNEQREMKQTLLNDDAGGGHLDNRQRRARVINGDAAGCAGWRRRAGATHGTGVAEALGAVLLRAVEEAQVELTAGVERHFRREGVRRRGAAQTRAQRLIDFENVHFTGERDERVPANSVRHVALAIVPSAVSIRA